LVGPRGRPAYGKRIASKTLRVGDYTLVVAGRAPDAVTPAALQFIAADGSSVLDVVFYR
jgi:hypothetical protein